MILHMLEQQSHLCYLKGSGPDSTKVCLLSVLISVDNHTSYSWLDSSS